MRVLHVVREVGGGSGKLLALLVPEQRRLGLDAQLVFRVDTGDLIPADASWSLRLGTTFSNVKLFRTFDVIHLHCVDSDVVLSCILSRRPVVFTLHGRRAHTRPVGSALRARVRPSLAGGSRVLRRHLLKWFLRGGCGAVTCPSLYLATYIEEAYRVPVKKTHVIPNCAYVPPHRQAGARTYVDDRAEEGGVKITWVGRLVSVKRVDRLLTACSLLREGLAYQVRLVGGGVLRQDLEEQVCSLGLDDHIRFVGSVRDPTRYLAEADVFVLPSEAEGLPLALVEAMACGVPAVVMVDGGGATELVRQADCGLVAESVEALARAIEELAGAPGLRRELGARGAVYYERELTPERCASRHAQLYTVVTSGR